MFPFSDSRVARHQLRWIRWVKADLSDKH
jgi:hypothetical protein